MLTDMLLEHRRSASIRLYGLDGVAEPGGSPHLGELEEIVGLTRDLLDADGAGINLLVDSLQVTVASTGPRPGPLTRDLSICSTVLRRHEQDRLVEIPDLRADVDLADHPFVDGRCASLRSYAAAPLRGKHGLALGTLCAWSDRPRHLDDRQRATLRQFGRAALAVLDERRRALVPDRVGALRTGPLTLR